MPLDADALIWSDMRKSDDPLLRVREAAEALALRPTTIRAWIYQGRLARVRVGKRAVRIPLSEVQRIIREGRDGK